MVEKLSSLRKNIHDEKNKTIHVQNSILEDNSYKDYDYDTSSVYLSKLEKGKGSRFNTSLYNPKIREMDEVDPHLEATPNNSTKKIRMSSENPEFQRTPSMGSFHGAVAKFQHNRSLDSKQKSNHNMRARRMINIYIQKDAGIRSFRPMKEERVAHALQNSGNNRYHSIDETQD